MDGVGKSHSHPVITYVNLMDLMDHEIIGNSYIFLYQYLNGSYG